MTPNTGGTEPEHHPGLKLLARAACRFDDAEQRTLFATRLDTDGAFLLAMVPPPLGARLEILFTPSGQKELPPIRARVFNVTEDVAHPERSGFGVVFAEMEPRTFDLLFQSLNVLGVLKSMSREPGAFHAERRAHPRVPVDLPALFRSPSGMERAVRIVDMSVSGAQLDPTDEAGPDIPPVGTDGHLSLTRAGVTLDQPALIVRTCATGERGSFAVRFEEIEPEAKLQIEALLIEALIGDAAADWTPAS